MKLKILYEDSNILAIEKPSGILVHPVPEQARYGTSPDKNSEETILSLFRKKYKKIEIVHRLDKETSGVMLLAKNTKAHEFLKEQFQERTIKKTYIALLDGWVRNDRGVINKPIGRSPKDFRRYLAGRGVRGELREAVTGYKVIKRLNISSHKYTYIEAYPKTGRTHQIRVHMKYLNHPIVGDNLYNPAELPLPNLSLRKGEEKRGDRMMLHAKSIEFENLKGEILKIESPIPLLFKKIVK